MNYNIGCEIKIFQNILYRLLTKLKKTLRFVVVFLVIIGWVFSGWPTIPFLNFPQKIQEAQATAPTFVSAGTVAVDTSGNCSITPGPPTHQANDIIIVSAWQTGGGPIDTATSGWAEIVEVDSTGDAAWYWTRATGAGTAGPTITGQGTDCFGIAYIIRGAIETGTPYEDATTAGDGATEDNTPDTATITTTNVDRFAMAFVAHGGESAGVTWSSGNPPDTWTANSNVDDANGTDAGFYVISKTIAAVGDVTTVVVGTMSAATLAVTLTLAFIPQPTAALTGTVTSSITEADIVTGGKTIILTLNGDNWVADGATFDAQRQNIINGLDSAQAEGTGWDAVVKANEVVGAVVRTSATVVTITLSAHATYNITATETITATIPSTAVVGGNALVATPTFTVSAIAVATITQNNFEFWEDNGALTPTAIWGNPDIVENVALNAIPFTNDPIDPGDEIRIRMNMTIGVATLDAAGEGFILAYSEAQDCTTASSWTDVDAAGGAGVWVFSSDTDVGDNTELANPTLLVSESDVAGRYNRSDPTTTNPNAVTAGQDLEWDWHVVYNSANTAGAKTYCFRIETDGGAALDAYNSDSYPRVDIRPATSDQMRHGNFFTSGTERGFFWAD